MPGYITVTEHEHAAATPLCHQCGFRTRHKQGSDDLWICIDCDPSPDIPAGGQPAPLSEKER